MNWNPEPIAIAAPRVDSSLSERLPLSIPTLPLGNYDRSWLCFILLALLKVVL